MSRRNIWHHLTKHPPHRESRPDTVKKCPIPPPPDADDEDQDDDRDPAKDKPVPSPSSDPRSADFSAA